jgi:hypothetical protein
MTQATAILLARLNCTCLARIYSLIFLRRQWAFLFPLWLWLLFNSIRENRNCFIDSIHSQVKLVGKGIRTLDVLWHACQNSLLRQSVIYGGSNSQIIPFPLSFRERRAQVLNIFGICFILFCFCGTGFLNSGLCTCTTGTLSLEPCLQSLNIFRNGDSKKWIKPRWVWSFLLSALRLVFLCREAAGMEKVVNCGLFPF